MRLSWDEMFQRLVQSWKDRARVVGAQSDVDEPFCEDCVTDPLLALTIEGDHSLEWWPHWMAHELRSAIMQVSFVVWKEVRIRPHYGLEIDDYVLGYGYKAREKQPLEAQEAVDAVGLREAEFTSWLQERLMNLGDFPAEVLKAGYPAP